VARFKRGSGLCKRTKGGSYDRLLQTHERAGETLDGGARKGTQASAVSGRNPSADWLGSCWDDVPSAAKVLTLRSPFYWRDFARSRQGLVGLLVQGTHLRIVPFFWRFTSSTYVSTKHGIAEVQSARLAAAWGKRMPCARYLNSSSRVSFPQTNQ
jgi:hypothetical protein